MRALKLSEDLRPISDLKTSPNDLVKQVEQSGRPVVLTRHGKGVAVLLSLQAFEDLEASAARVELLGALKEAQKDVDAGNLISDDKMNALFTQWDDSLTPCE